MVSSPADGAQHRNQFYFQSYKDKSIMLEKLLESFRCPITHQIMFEPVQASDGKTYEREAFEEYILHKKKSPISDFSGEKEKSPASTVASNQPTILSPMTGDPLKNLEVTPNDAMLSLIRSVLNEHPEHWDDVYFVKRFIEEALSAIKIGDAGILERLIEKDKRLLEKEINAGKNLVEVVCQKGTPELLGAVLKGLKKNNKIVTVSDAKWKDLLLACVENMKKPGVRCFIELNEWTTERCEASFKTCVIEGNVKLVEALIEYGYISIDKPLDEQGNTALHLAVEANKPLLIQRLIMMGADSKLPNQEGLNAKQLAQKKGERALARNISQWQHDKKSEKMSQEIAQLRAENTQLKSELLEARKNLASMSGRFFSTYVRKPFLDVSQQKNQDEFVAVILGGDVEKIATMKGLMDRSNSQGLLPLVAAAYSGLPQMFYYIEGMIKDPGELREYFSQIDLDRVKTAILQLLPEVRPPHATHAWIGDWYEKNAGKKWCPKYDGMIHYNWFQDARDWVRRKHIWFEEAQIVRDERHELNSATKPTSVFLTWEGCLDPKQEWVKESSSTRKGYYLMEYLFSYIDKETIYDPSTAGRAPWDRTITGYREHHRSQVSHKKTEGSWTINYIPSPEKHDAAVANLIQEFTSFEKDLTDKVSEAKQYQKALGF